VPLSDNGARVGFVGCWSHSGQDKGKWSFFESDGVAAARGLSAKVWARPIAESETGFSTGWSGQHSSEQLQESTHSPAQVQVQNAVGNAVGIQAKRSKSEVKSFTKNAHSSQKNRS